MIFAFLSPIREIFDSSFTGSDVLCIMEMRDTIFGYILEISVAMRDDTPGIWLNWSK
jgi:hypothetical protein